MLNNDNTATETIKVAYLGPPGSYSHQAAIQATAKKSAAISEHTNGSRSKDDSGNVGYSLIPHASIKSCFDSLMLEKSVQQAIVPESNSSNGKVIETANELSKYNKRNDGKVDNDDDDGGDNNLINIVSSNKLQIRHSLLGRRNGDNDLKRTIPHFIYSHPQALGQCRRYLEQRYHKTYNDEPVDADEGTQKQRKQQLNNGTNNNNVVDGKNGISDDDRVEKWPIIKPVSSTSLAAQLAHEDVCGKTFAISSKICAEVYELDIIEESIQDAGLENVTTFITIVRK